MTTALHCRRASSGRRRMGGRWQASSPALAGALDADVAAHERRGGTHGAVAAEVLRRDTGVVAAYAAPRSTDPAPYRRTRQSTGLAGKGQLRRSERLVVIDGPDWLCKKGGLLGSSGNSTRLSYRLDHQNNQWIGDRQTEIRKVK